MSNKVELCLSMEQIKENELEQGTDAWHKWRSQGIGGSEVAAIMGISPWKTAFELWENKIGKRVDSTDYSFITEKGHRLEPKIRAMYEIQTGLDATPILVMRKDKPEHRASLDGRDEEEKVIAEFKFVGAGEKWEMALDGKLPDYYYAQCQWQLYVTGDKYVNYVAYNEKENKIKIVKVDIDMDYIYHMVNQVEAWWKFVLDKKEPPLTDKDWKTIKNKNMKELVTELRELTEKVRVDNDRIRELSTLIKEHDAIKHPRCICYGVKVIEKTRKGSVNWQKIVKDKLPDIETSAYIKPSTTYKELKL